MVMTMSDIFNLSPARENTPEEDTIVDTIKRDANFGVTELTFIALNVQASDMPHFSDIDGALERIEDTIRRIRTNLKLLGWID